MPLARKAVGLLGYATRSAAQIETLVHATRDADETVRNNAIRAVGVLAQSNAEGIPAEPFVDLLKSGIWKDRNKGVLVLERLTREREPKGLALVCSQDRDVLQEMARWRDPGHSSLARAVLERCDSVQ